MEMARVKQIMAAPEEVSVDTVIALVISELK